MLEPSWHQMAPEPDHTTNQKNDHFLGTLRNDFWWILGKVGRQVGAKLAPKWDQKSMLTPKGVFSKNSSFPNEKLGLFGSKTSKLTAKTDQKSIKKWNPRWNASWHRFLSDFGGFWEPSWGQVGGKLALKIDGKSIQKGLGVCTSLWGRSRRLQSVNH